MYYWAYNMYRDNTYNNKKEKRIDLYGNDVSIISLELLM